jgi:pimeloyl-ACP methyl ester carboxylesterase
MLLRSFLSLLGVLLALPVLVLIALAFSVPITISGIGYLLASSLAIAGLITAPWTGKYSFLLIGIGLIGITFIGGTRLVLATQGGDSNLRVITLPQGKETRWINYLIDEQDSLIFGEALFHRIGGDSPREHAGLTDALHNAYYEMRETRQNYPSPFLSTYLNLQRSTAFDAIIVEPETMRHPDTAVIFLHGYMGNVTAQCWEIAQAIGKFGAVTICPSTDWTGQWWQPEGEAILQATFRYLREQGIENFYLGGFSNGGFGISRLVSTISKEDGLRGLFFINGISDGTSIRETGLPVLIIQGAQDERVPAQHVRQVAGVIGDSGTYVEVEGDHFMIMKQPKAVQSAMTNWLETHGSTQ